jgi:hypothetical protein
VLHSLASLLAWSADLSSYAPRGSLPSSHVRHLTNSRAAWDWQSPSTCSSSPCSLILSRSLLPRLVSLSLAAMSAAAELLPLLAPATSATTVSKPSFSRYLTSASPPWCRRRVTTAAPPSVVIASYYSKAAAGYRRLSQVQARPKAGHGQSPIGSSPSLMAPPYRPALPSPVPLSALLCLREEEDHGSVPMTSGPHLKEQCHLKFTDFALSSKIHI